MVVGWVLVRGLRRLQGGPEHWVLHDCAVRPLSSCKDLTCARVCVEECVCVCVCRSVGGVLSASLFVCV